MADTVQVQEARIGGSSSEERAEASARPSTAVASRRRRRSGEDRPLTVTPIASARGAVLVVETAAAEGDPKAEQRQGKSDAPAEAPLWHLAVRRPLRARMRGRREIDPEGPDVEMAARCALDGLENGLVNVKLPLTAVEKLARQLARLDASAPRAPEAMLEAAERHRHEVAETIRRCAAAELTQEVRARLVRELAREHTYARLQDETERARALRAGMACIDTLPPDRNPFLLRLYFDAYVRYRSARAAAASRRC